MIGAAGAGGKLRRAQRYKVTKLFTVFAIGDLYQVLEQKTPLMLRR